MFIKVRRSDAAPLSELNAELFLFSNISLKGPINFLRSYLLGYFFIILAKHMTAFFRTLGVFRELIAISTIASESEVTSVLGTVVAIIERARL
jgi:hypothetical protein